MLLISKYQRQLTEAITGETRRSWALAWAVFLISLTVLAAGLGWIGAPVMNGRPWDVMVQFDTAWRMLNGQVPHRDFFSHIGALPSCLALIGAKLSHMSVAALAYGNLVLMAALSLPAMAVLCRRTSALQAVFFSIYIALLSAMPRPLGDPYDCVDYAMIYNRYGEAFLAVLGIILFLPPRNPGRARADILEGAFAGLLLTALWFTKVSYCVIGAGFLGAAALFGYCRLPMAASCVGAALASLAAAHWFSGIPFGAMLADFRIVALAQNKGDRLGLMIVQFAKFILLLPILLLITWERFCGGRIVGVSRGELFRAWLFPLFIYACSFLLLSANAQVEEMPLLAVAALFGVEMARRQTATSGMDPFMAAVRNLGCLTLLLFFTMPTMGPDLKTARNILFSFHKPSFSSETLAMTRLSDFRFKTVSGQSPSSSNYVECLDEGIQLLRRHKDPQMRLSALLFADPFHVALGIAPARGGIVCIANNIISAKSHPALDRVIGDATHLLIAHDVPYRDYFGPEWDALNLEPVESTRHFTLVKIGHPPASK